LLIA
jgi:hypothetical protein